MLHEAGLPTSCEECRGLLPCHDATTLTSDGDLVRVPDMPGVVAWPDCPNRHARLRWLGGSAVTLDAALAWLVAKGAHRHPALGSGAAGIYREYIAQRRLGRVMSRARAYAESKRRRP